MNQVEHLETLIILLMISSAVGIAVKRIRLPYAIALVITGLIIGICHVLPAIELNPNLILLVFLPALLFEASWNINLEKLKKNWLPIFVLATLGVFINMVIAGYLLNWLGGLTCGLALLFGAIIAATDPISVLALFKSLGVDKRLSLILEGESLLNDGTAVVLFQLVLFSQTGSGHLSFPAAVIWFIWQIIGGAAIGVFIGFCGSKVTGLIEEHLIEITITTITAWGACLAAEHLCVSPVIAVVASGITGGTLARKAGMTQTSLLAVDAFWEYAAFAFNSIIFLLIGMQVKLELLLKYWQLIVIGVVSLLVARAIVIYCLCPFLSSKSVPIPINFQHVLFWGALRGALCMAMVLSLPVDLPRREELSNLIFGVVLFTLIVQGLTIEPLVRKLELIKDRIDK